MSTFIIRTDDIAGLNAQEIAEKLALPKVPNRVVEVELPPSTPLEVSITGPQQGYSVIKFKSYRAEGINYVIYDNFENILLPRNIVPVN